jgi:hypothetical protein
MGERSRSAGEGDWAVHRVLPALAGRTTPGLQTVTVVAAGQLRDPVVGRCPPWCSAAACSSRRICARPGHDRDPAAAHRRGGVRGGSEIEVGERADRSAKPGSTEASMNSVEPSQAAGYLRRNGAYPMGAALTGREGFDYWGKRCQVMPALRWIQAWTGRLDTPKAPRTPRILPECPPAAVQLLQTVRASLAKSSQALSEP